MTHHRAVEDEVNCILILFYVINYESYELKDLPFFHYKLGTHPNKKRGGEDSL